MPAKPGVLNHVFRIRRGAEHPVGDSEQSAPVLLEDIMFDCGHSNILPGRNQASVGGSGDTG